MIVCLIDRAFARSVGLLFVCLFVCVLCCVLDLVCLVCSVGSLFVCSCL